MTAFPNPITSENSIITVAINADVTTLNVQLVNTQGQVVLSDFRTISEDMPYFKMDLKELEPGVYFLNISSEDWSATEKIVVLNSF